MLFEFIPPAITDFEILERLPAAYRESLQRQNGFIAFGGGLHVRGACQHPAWHSLRAVWVGQSALHLLYPAVSESDVPFAEDCVGDQYLMRGGKVHRLLSETGAVEALGLSWEEFLIRADDDPTGFLSLNVLFQFQQQGGELQPGELLSVDPPFYLKNESRQYSFRAVPALERLTALAKLARLLASS